MLLLESNRFRVRLHYNSLMDEFMKTLHIPSLLKDLHSAIHSGEIVGNMVVHVLSFFIRTCLFTQDIVILAKCYTFSNMRFWPQYCSIDIFQENDIFQCELPFVSITKIHKYGRTFVLMKQRSMRFPYMFQSTYHI